MDRRTVGHRRVRPFPKARRKQMRGANINAMTDDSSINHDQRAPTRDKKSGLASKESNLNGFDNPSSHSDATGKTHSSRNIIASNFNQKQSEKTDQLTKVESSSETFNCKKDRFTSEPLKYNAMIYERQISDYIVPYLKLFGLEDARSYTELHSECFIRNIDGLYYCALCCQKIPNNQCLDFHCSNSRHVDLFLKLRSKLINTTPSSDSMNMAALRDLMTMWLDKNEVTDTQKQEYIAEEFARIVEDINPQCQCRIVGSFYTETSLSNSAVNLELLHPNDELFQSDPRAKNSIHHKLVDPDAEYGYQINNHTLHYDLISNAVDTLYKIADFVNCDLVGSFKLERTNFCSDLNAKIPRLLLTHVPTKVRLEVCCYAESNYQLDNLLRNYIYLDKRVRQLSILVKQWAEICRISNPEEGTFTPETLIILVIHFLQRVEPPVLPCLHEHLGKNDDKTRKPSDNLTDQSKKLDNTDQQQLNDLPETSNLVRSEVPEDNIDVADEEVEEDIEVESSDHNFDKDSIDSLAWKSKNCDPIHKLFVDFLKFSMSEFANLTSVISIRSLRRITVHDKKWNTQVKPIENPVRPSVNLAKNIGSMRTFEYIKQCFSHGYYYLTSIPLTENLKRVTNPPSDPSRYVRLFFNLNRFDFYLKMKKQKIESGAKGDFIDEMIQQGLFARDVEVIKNIVEYRILEGKNLDQIPLTLARNYESILLMPPDRDATTFCWLCRFFGHTKVNCPKKTIDVIKQLDPYIDTTVSLDAGFAELYYNDILQTEDLKLHYQIVQELTDIISSGTGLDCVLELFGSTVNHLGCVDSDMDICMTLKDNRSGRGVDCVKILKKTCAVLSRNEHVKNLEPILAARVPIIKFKYDKFDVDLSMYNQCAIHNSNLLRKYVSLDGRVAQLCYLVKQYARSCGIADASRGSLSSYAWSLMVIHFLQHTSPPMLPVLQETAKLAEKPVYGVNGWNVWFDHKFEPKTQKNPDTSLTSLFKEFLLYYSTFDFSRYVVSIRTSKKITKFQKNWTQCMMAIEDPFELTYNLSGRLDDSMALYIMNSFPRTLNHVCSFQIRCRRISHVPTTDNLRSLFNGRDIMRFEPPYRGCRLCHRIGHRIKDCPEKRQPQQLPRDERASLNDARQSKTFPKKDKKQSRKTGSNQA